METIYAKFTQPGMGIRDTVSRERFKEIQGRLSQIQAEFRKNLGCQADEIFMTLAELDGVPEFLVKQLENNSSNNMLRIELSHPVHEGILWFAEKSETRKKLYVAMQNRFKGNVPLLFNCDIGLYTYRWSASLPIDCINLRIF